MKKLNYYAYGLIQAKIADLEVAHYCRELKLNHIKELLDLNRKNRSGDKRQEEEIERLIDEQFTIDTAQQEIEAKLDKYREILEESDKL